MKRSLLIKTSLSLSSTLLLVMAWPPSAMNFLLLFAYVPVMLNVFNAKRLREAYGWFYLTYVTFLLIMHWPLFVEGFQLGALIFGLFLVPVFWCAPFLASVVIKRKYGLEASLLILPFLYVSQEVIHYYWDFAFTWVHLGLGLANSPWLMGIYPFLGPEGGAFIVIAFNGAFFYLLRVIRKERFKFNTAIPALSLVAILMLTYLLQPLESAGKAVKIAVFQPSTAEYNANPDNLTWQVNHLNETLVAGHFSGADLLICPESYLLDMKKKPLFVNDLKAHHGVQQLIEVSQKYDTPILTGAILVEMYRSTIPPTHSAKRRDQNTFFDIYNGSVFITPDQEVFWRTKQSLVPFAEKVPFYNWFNRLEQSGLWPSRYDNTYGIVPFKGPYVYHDLKIAPAVCYEGLFPPVISSYLNKKANLQVILSNGWTGSNRLLEQQQAYTQVNYQAFGKPVVINSMDGWSAVSDKNGVLQFDKSDLSIKEIVLTENRTVYANLADLPWMWWIATLGVFLGQIFVRRRLLFDGK